MDKKALRCEVSYLDFLSLLKRRETKLEKEVREKLDLERGPHSGNLKRKKRVSKVIYLTSGARAQVGGEGRTRGPYARACRVAQRPACGCYPPLRDSHTAARPCRSSVRPVEARCVREEPRLHPDNYTSHHVTHHTSVRVYIT
jgi:hypothetical protein